jgi:hypothetical protein
LRVAGSDHAETRLGNRDERDEMGLQEVGIARESCVERAAFGAVETRRVAVIVST